MVDQTPERTPRAGRPRMFGGHLEPLRLPWRWAERRLSAARNYWICTTRPDGRPHSRPVWAVWLEGALYFSTGSLAAANLPANPAITVHLESGSETVIIESVATMVTDPLLTRRIVAAYNEKYNWDIDPEQLPGPFYEIKPTLVFGWVSDDSGLDGGAAFHGTATRWQFP